jgi:hypothetical protein
MKEGNLLILLYILFQSIQSIKKSHSTTVNFELEKKLDDLFSHYKKLIDNSDEKDKYKIMQSLKSQADGIIIDKEMFKNNTKTINEMDSMSSFIQNSITETSSESPIDSNFNYQPFVWTEFTINNPGNSVPSSRRGHSSLVADTFMIVFGGCYMESKCFNDVYFLDFRSQSWITFNTSGKVPSPRQGHSAVLYGSTMWIYGGSSSEGYLNDLYSLNLETVIFF